MGYSNFTHQEFGPIRIEVKVKEWISIGAILFCYYYYYSTVDDSFNRYYYFHHLLRHYGNQDYNFLQRNNH